MDRRQFFLTAAVAAFTPRLAASAPLPRPPVTAVRPRVITQLGRERTDDFAWLRDPNWKQVSRGEAPLNAEIRAHLEDENRYAETILAPTKPRQAQYAAAMMAMGG